MDYIYFLHDRTSNAIKIGCSKYPEQRMREIQIMIPGDAFPLRYVEVAGNGFDVERTLHMKFRGIRIKGEWFKATPELLDFAESGVLPNSTKVEVVLTPSTRVSVPRLSLKELTAQTKVAARTVRYYVSEGLLKPPVTSGKYAKYTEEHIKTINDIQNMQEEGMSLGEIRQRISPAELVIDIHKKRATCVTPVVGVKMIIDEDVPSHISHAFIKAVVDAAKTLPTYKGD